LLKLVNSHLEEKLPVNTNDSLSSSPKKTRGVSHSGLAIYTKKYLKAKEELWKFKYFTMQKYNLQKKSSKRNKNPSRYHNSITNPKFQHQQKYHLSNILLSK
jgi:hypothetical protein